MTRTQNIHCLMDFTVIILALSLILSGTIVEKHRNNNLLHFILSTIFVNEAVQEDIAHCPYLSLCLYSYDSLLVGTNESSTACCKPCGCKDVCAHMTCCSQITPCKHPTYNKANQELVCIPTTVVSEVAMPGILAIVTCTEGSDTTDKAKCQQIYGDSVDIYDIIPVSDNNGTVYRNVHCATCNGVQLDNLKYWSLNVACAWTSYIDITDYSNILTAVRQTVGCDIMFSNPDPEASISYCSSVIDTCNITGLWINYSDFENESCQTVETQYERFRRMVFRNGYCGRCNGLQTGDIVFFPPDKPSLSILIAPNIGAKHVSDVELPDKCDSGFLFHTLKDECIEVRCSVLRRFRNGACVLTSQKLEKFTYRIGLRIKAKSFVHVKVGYASMNEVAQQLNSLFHLVFGLNIFLMYEFALVSDIQYHKNLNVSESLAGNLLFYEVRLKLHVPYTHDPEKSLNELLDVVATKEVGIVTDRRVVSTQLILMDDAVYFPYNRLYKYPCSYTMVDNFEPCFDPDEQTAFPAFHPPNRTIIPYVGVVDEKYKGRFYEQNITFDRNILEFRPCLFHEVFRNESYWEEHDDGLEFIDKGVYVNSSDFLYGTKGESIWVCRDKYNVIFNAGNSDQSWQNFVGNFLTFIMVTWFCF